MMLHTVQFCAESFTWEGLLKQNGDRRASAAIA